MRFATGDSSHLTCTSDMHNSRDISKSSSTILAYNSQYKMHTLLCIQSNRVTLRWECLVATWAYSLGFLTSTLQQIWSTPLLETKTYDCSFHLWILKFQHIDIIFLIKYDPFQNHKKHIWESKANLPKWENKQTNKEL